MRNILRISLISALMLCMACEKEPLPDPPFNCSVPVSETNLITAIDETADTITFHLESGERVRWPQSCINSYSIDTSQWFVQINYADSTMEQLPFFGHLVIDPDSVILDPYEHAPLTALVKFSIPYARKAKITIHGKEPSSPDLTHTFREPVTEHVLPVYGLYADYLNLVTIHILDQEGEERITDTLYIQTAPPSRLDCGPMTVEVNNHADTTTPHFYLVHNAIHDSEGYLRWYSEYRGVKYFPLSDHQIAMQLRSDKGDPSTVWEDLRVMNLIGQRTGLYDVPNRNHHEINEKTPGGNLLVATNAEPYNSTDDDTEDAIVEIDRQSGEVVKFWDLRDIFDPTRPRLWTEMPNDWCHLNSIQYDSTDNTLLISSKLQYFIAKIDYETGAIRWIFGNHENWKEPWQPYLLEPENFDMSVHPDRDWTYAQHMPRLTGEGHIIVYDNGRSRPGGSFTRALEFKVDTAKMTVRKVWTKDFDFSVRALGSVHKHDNGNVVIGHGELGLLVEVNQLGEIVFQGRTQVFYRAYPIEFYQL